MASVRTNIINALGWFYERLTENDLEPIRDEIRNLNSNTLRTTSVNDDMDNPDGSGCIIELVESTTSQSVAQLRISEEELSYRLKNGTGWSDWRTV